MPRRVKSTLNVKKRSSTHLTFHKSGLDKESERVGGGISRPAFAEAVLEIANPIQRAAVPDEVTQNDFF
jgi:hypothetical protein